MEVSDRMECEDWRAQGGIELMQGVLKYGGKTTKREECEDNQGEKCKYAIQSYTEQNN